MGDTKGGDCPNVAHGPYFADSWVKTWEVLDMEPDKQ